MITAQQVTEWAGISLPEGDAAMSLAVAATNRYVDSLPSIDRTPEGEWAETTELGAIMLASRVYRRKNSPGGIEAVGEVTTFVARFDSDIDRLLNVNSYRKPVIG